MEKPQPDWTEEQWEHLNHELLEGSNVTVLSAGALSISFCLVCEELLIRHNNRHEAATFILDEDTYEGFMGCLLPQINAYQAAVLHAGMRCAYGGKVLSDDRPVESTPQLAAAYRNLLAAIAGFEERFSGHRKPKVGEANVSKSRRLLE